MERSEPTDIFARRLKEAMKAAKLNQEKLAEAMGVERQTVSAWISRRSLPTKSNLNKLVVILKRDIGWFFGDPEASFRATPEFKELVGRLRTTLEAMERLDGREHTRPS